MFREILWCGTSQKRTFQHLVIDIKYILYIKDKLFSSVSHRNSFDIRIFFNRIYLIGFNNDENVILFLVKEENIFFS